jgi:hypothetical protein
LKPIQRYNDIMIITVFLSIISAWGFPHKCVCVRDRKRERECVCVCVCTLKKIYSYICFNIIVIVTWNTFIIMALKMPLDNLNILSSWYCILDVFSIGV